MSTYVGTLDSAEIGVNVPAGETARDAPFDVYAEMAERLREAIPELRQMALAGDLDTSPSHVGLEREFCLVDEGTLKPVCQAFGVIPSDGDSDEAYLWQKERVSPVFYVGDADGLRAVTAWARQQFADLRSRAPSGVEVVAMGIVPTINWDRIGQRGVTPSPRYRELFPRMEHIAGQHRWTARFEGPKGEYIDTSNGHFGLVGLIFGDQTSVAGGRVSNGQAARRARIALALSPVWIALGQNSLVLPGGQFGWRSNRLRVWENAAPTYAGIGRLFPHVRGDSLAWRLEELLWRGHPVTTYAPPSASVLDLALVYLKGEWGLVRELPLPASACERLELRGADAASTPRDSGANAALEIASLMAYEGMSFEELVPDWVTVHTNVHAACQHGLDGRMTWRGNDTEIREVAKEVLCAAVQWLKRLGVEGEELLPVVERVELNRTGSDWQRESMEDLLRRGMTSTEAAEYLVAAAVELGKDLEVTIARAPKAAEILAL